MDRDSINIIKENIKAYGIDPQAIKFAYDTQIQIVEEISNPVLRNEMRKTLRQAVIELRREDIIIYDDIEVTETGSFLKKIIGS